MHDLLLAALWLGILGGGVAVVLGLHRLGLPRTYVRDLLHVGAGSWVLGWPFWRGWVIPSLITLGAFALLAALPRLVARVPLLAKVRDGVSDDEERWSGLVLYAASFAVLTPIGLRGAAFPAAAALLALAFGDGVGGLVGRRFGRTRYRIPGAKTKSVEGTIAVAAAAALGIALAARWFDVPVAPVRLGLAAVAAAAAEALAPRASDNLTVPAAAWLVLVV